jgi:hypothetical protein
MAYLPSNNWWLNGPKNPQGGGCGGACGETGMGQVAQGSPGLCTDGTPEAIFQTLGSCGDGSLPACPTGQVWAGYCIGGSPTAGPSCPSGQVCSWIAGIPNNYLLIGGAVIFGALLLGMAKK